MPQTGDDVALLQSGQARTSHSQLVGTLVRWLRR
jgi:hypothetical protein